MEGIGEKSEEGRWQGFSSYFLQQGWEGTRRDKGIQLNQGIRAQTDVLERLLRDGRRESLLGPQPVVLHSLRSFQMPQEVRENDVRLNGALMRQVSKESSVL